MTPLAALHLISLRTALLLAGLLIIPTTVFAQINVGADLASRYVWRGTDFGESFSIQPTLEYSTGAVTVGTWASYAIVPDGAGFNEHDLYLSISAGPFSVGVTDYYFPGPESPGVFNFENGGEGAHQIEPYASVTGPEAFPLTFYGAVFVYNEPDNSVYLEASYPFAVEGVDLNVAVGMTPMESDFYGTSKAGLINIALSASKAIPITDEFALPIGVSYIINPYAERTFLVFGISI